jgi:hypothetical protein
MRAFHVGDPRVEAHLLRAEEHFAKARALAARRALLRAARPPRRRARIWLGSVLLAIGHRLLGSVPSSAGPAYAGGALARDPDPHGSCVTSQ